MNTDHFLIVDAAPTIAGLPELLEALAADGGPDPYSARQRLLGRGLALLARGEQQRLAPLTRPLAAAGVRHWLVAPQTPRFAPERLRSLAVAEANLTLVGTRSRLVIPRGARVLACLADLSGQAADKALKRLVVQNAYRGQQAVTPIGDDEFLRAVLQGRPVLDIYLLDPEQIVAGAVRVWPGRYDPRGLGPRLSYSAVANLETVLEVLRGLAGHCELRTDFGIASLPGCQLKRTEAGSPGERENLVRLTRFGWLAAQLFATAPGATAEAAAIPPLTVVDQVLATAGEPPLEDPADARPAPPALPPPPELAADQSWRGNRLLVRLGGVGGVTAGLAVALLQGGPPLQRALWHYGVRPGLLPGLLSAALAWWAYRLLRRKRAIENTPTSKVRSLALGMVEVQGRARRHYALVAPMTQLPCVWYRLHRFRRDRRNNWRLTSSSGSGPLPFSLEDATGRVLVDPRGAHIRARTREEGVAGQFGMFGRSGGDGNEKWIEEVIVDGASLYVLGYADQRAERRPSLRERTIARLRALKADREALRRFDRNGDGRIDEQEWQTARQAMETEALQESLAEAGTNAAERIRIGRPLRGGLPFVIAETASELRLTRTDGVLIMVLFTGSVLALAWTLALLFRLFHPG